MSGITDAGEFETIRRLFAPLAHPEWARGLMDDVAVLPSRPGHDLVLTKDAIVEGVHFLPDDPLDTVASKLLRVNLSDLAAKGAVPFGYLLACHWSPRCGWAEREAFVQGLGADQAEFGIQLLGGDTVSSPGPASFSATMLGWAPRGRAVNRSGAAVDDLVLVTGVIGDGWLGLQAALGRLSLGEDRHTSLIEHYRRPMPRSAFADAILHSASASADVSDGLLADLGHICAASGVGMTLDLERLPLSAAGHAWQESRADAEACLLQLATGGDDYEIAFTAPPAHEKRLRREAERLHLRLTALGRVVAGQGVTVRHDGRVLAVERAGWTHR
ncbi:thiamine-phosphate kinase [Rhizobium sp. CRIBSB]|nr:thiamine-phosphate kinase [Rhizobium sp. CRIBSB]